MKKRNVLVRGVSYLILKEIKQRAKENLRSMNGEILSILAKVAKKR